MYYVIISFFTVTHCITDLSGLFMREINTEYLLITSLRRKTEIHKMKNEKFVLAIYFTDQLVLINSPTKKENKFEFVISNAILHFFVLGLQLFSIPTTHFGKFINCDFHFRH